MTDLGKERIDRIEKVVIRSTRPRECGCNARRGSHGAVVTDPVVRVHTASGAVGVGWSPLDLAGARALVGRTVGELFQLPAGALDAGAIIDLPLWDLAAKLAGQPLYRLLGARGSREVELYDGSIYIDDLELSDTDAVALFEDEVRTGHRYGYQSFKIKIGRGARWMPSAAGFERDLLVIDTVRAAAGEHAKILVDANNGGTLNTTKDTLSRCAAARIFWFEEPFAEDPELNADLKTFIRAGGADTLVADGESSPRPASFFDMVERGDIDLVQHDFRFSGLTWWQATAARIEQWGARCAPHSWGSIVERFPHAHFAASVPHYCLLEAAPADSPDVVLDGWQQRDGKLIVPDSPGAGFDVEAATVERGVVAEDGFRVDR